MIRNKSSLILFPLLSSILITSAFSIAFGMVAPILSLNLEQKLGSGTVIGLLVAVVAIATITTSPLILYFLHYIKGKTLLKISIIVNVFVFIGYMFADSVFMIFFLRFIQSVCFTVIFVLCEIWLNQCSPDHHRGKILASYSITLASSVMLGTSLVHFIGISGYKPWIIGIFLSLAIFPVLFLPSEDIIAPDRTSKKLKNLKSLINTTFSHPEIMGAAFIVNALEMSVFYLFPVFIVRLSYPEKFATYLLMCGTIGVVFLQFPLGKLMDKIDNQLILKGLILICILFPLLYLLPNINRESLAIISFIYFGSIAGLYTIGLVILGRTFKKDQIVVANAAYSSSGGVGALLIPPLAGLTMDITSKPAAFMITLSLISFVYLILLLVKKTV